MLELAEVISITDEALSDDQLKEDQVNVPLDVKVDCKSSTDVVAETNSSVESTPGSTTKDVE